MAPGRHESCHVDSRFLHAPRRTVDVDGWTHEKGARLICKRPARRLQESRLIDRTSSHFPLLAAALLCSLFAAGCGDDAGPTEPPDPPGPPEGFQIEIRYVEGTEPTEEQRGYFDAAVERWEQAIVGDLEEVYVNQPTPFTCQKLTAPAMDEEIDDLLVYVEFGQLEDPPGENYVGWGGPCVLRDSYLPAVSSITIDIDDLHHLGTWLVVHELAHALGFGEVWLEFGLLTDPSHPDNGRPGPIEPVEDATISSYFADQNFGVPDGSSLSENLVVGENLGMWTDGPDDEVLAFFLRFELPPLITAPPVKAMVVLHLSDSFDDDDSSVGLRQVLSPWEEDALTWEAKPETGFTLYGGKLDSAAGVYTVKATTQVGDWFSIGNNGLVIEPVADALPTSDFSFGFHTRHAADPGLRPHLILEPDTRFAGPAATAAFDEIGGDIYEGAVVPVENNLLERAGSVDAHWRSTVLRREIMAPSGNSQSAFSIVTIASMEDLGYEVDYSAADRYTLPTLVSVQPPVSEFEWTDGTGAGPKYRVGASGQLSIILR